MSSNLINLPEPYKARQFDLSGLAAGTPPLLPIALGGLAEARYALGDRASAMRHQCKANESWEQLLSGALQTSGDEQKRAASGSAAASPRRFARSCSTCAR